MINYTYTDSHGSQDLGTTPFTVPTVPARPTYLQSKTNLTSAVECIRIYTVH